MQLKTTIKASSVQHLTDARYFAAWGTAWVGFCLSPENPNFLHPQQVKAIVEWLSGPQTVGEFSSEQTLEDIEQVIHYLGLNTVQLAYTGDNLARFKHLAQKTSVIATVSSLDNIEEIAKILAPLVSFLIVDITDWAALETEQLETLKNACTTLPVMLNIDKLDDTLALDILANYPIYGFNLTGGAEEKVGFKSFDEIDPIFEALEDEEY